MDRTLRGDHQSSRQKQIDAKDCFIEENTRPDPVTTPEHKLVIDVYVPIQLKRESCAGSDALLDVCGVWDGAGLAAPWQESFVTRLDR